MDNNGGNSAAMAILVVALIAVVGIFVYFMSTNHNQNMTFQAPAPQISAPKVELPTPGQAQ